MPNRFLCRAIVAAMFLHLAFSQNAGDHLRFKRNRRDVKFIQQQIIRTHHPQPILDTAKPEELCCNTKQHRLGIALVNGYDSATGVLINLVQFPQRSKVQIGKGITEYLDMIGGRLVGLQR